MLWPVLTVCDCVTLNLNWRELFRAGVIVSSMKPYCLWLSVHSVRSQANLHFDKENVEQRQATLSKSYQQLGQMAEVGRKV